MGSCWQGSHPGQNGNDAGGYSWRYRCGGCPYEPWRDDEPCRCSRKRDGETLRVRL